MKFLTSLAFALLTLGPPLWAQTSVEKPLPVQGVVAQNGSAIELTWFAADPPRVGNVQINRRKLGETGGASWRMIASELGPVMRFKDTTTKPGVGYEYQVLRSARDIVDVGYWTGGTALPPEDHKGIAFVIVDDTVAAPLAAHLDRFQDDLTGDGWRVIRHETPRALDFEPVKNLRRARALKGWLKTRFQDAPFANYTLILVGHVPIVKSGRAAPDGHEVTPQPTDLFYAEMNGDWPDNGQGILWPTIVPTSRIEMQVGRIDFANQSTNGTNEEILHLQAYFDKNHHWRHGILGDLRQAYGQGKHLVSEQNQLRNIVGSGAFFPGGHHDVGEARPWLWGVDFGAWNGRLYATDYAIKAVFALNFGSGKQKFDLGLNPMNALLAQPWYPIAVGWGARPAWWIHHMALGKSMGYSHMRTVNNGVATSPYRTTMDYFPTGEYLWRNPVWVNLLGDPTAHGFPLASPASARATTNGDQTTLSWDASGDADVTGYRIYRADAATADFIRIGPDIPKTQTSYIDLNAPQDAHYMVRAIGLKRVAAGSFYALSQGRFASRQAPAALTARTLTTGVDQPLVLSPTPKAATTPGTIHAFIEGPRSGRLERQGDDWLYTPEPGFRGEIRLRLSGYDGQATQQSVLTIKVGD